MTRFRRALAAAALAWLSTAAGCSAARRFPLGLYGLSSPEDLPKVREAGFDSFHTTETALERLEPLARRARELGLGLLASPDSLRDGPRDSTRGWPLAGWYLFDEPDVHRLSPQALKELHGKTKGWDPDRPTVVCVGEGKSAAAFGGAADILMLDWYPVPHLALDSVADQLDLARKAIGKDKTLWAVLQAFDWRDYPQRDPKKPRVGRFPDHAEIRFMSYLAIVHGADGLFYYTWRKPGRTTLGDHPEQWQALARVVYELRSLQPILEGGAPAPPPPGARLEGLESRFWRYRGKTLALLLNRNRGTPARVPAELLSPRWRALFGTRRDPKGDLREDGGAWLLEPHKVLLLEGPAD